MAEDLAEGHAGEPEEGAGGLAAEPEARAAGWYPDPFGRRAKRWWDGTEWTAYAGDGRDVRFDPAPLESGEPIPAGLPGIVVAVVGFAAGVALSVVVQILLERADSPGGRSAEIGLGSLGLWTGVMAATLFVSVRRGTRSFVRDFGLRFRWSDLGLGLAASLAGRVVAGLAVTPIPLPSRQLGDDEREVFEGAMDGPGEWLVLVAVVCIGAPLVEEIFFRGLLQTRLVGRLGPVVGITVASIVFGAAHLIAWDGPLTLAYAWAVAGGGLVLGTTYHFTRRLGTAIVGHALFNAQAVFLTWLLA